MGILDISFIVLVADRPKNRSQWLQEFNSSPDRRALSDFVKQKFLPACIEWIPSILCRQARLPKCIPRFAGKWAGRLRKCSQFFNGNYTKACLHWVNPVYSLQAGLSAIMHFQIRRNYDRQAGCFLRIEKILMLQLIFDIISVVEKRIGQQWIFIRTPSFLAFPIA